MELQRIIEIGHNNPPSEIEILKQRLEDYEEINEGLERLSNREIPDIIETDEQAGKISDYIASVNMLGKDIEDAHKKEKKPFWDAGKAADEWKNNKLELLKPLVAKASKPLLAWNKKKEEEEKQRQLEVARKAREEADKLVEQAHAHAEEGIEETAQELLNAAVQADTKADLIQNSAFDLSVKSRGGFSSSGIQRPWVGEIESKAAIDLEELRHYFKLEEIQTALTRAVKDGKRDIRGAKIYQDEKLTNRRRV